MSNKFLSEVRRLETDSHASEDEKTVTLDVKGHVSEEVSEETSLESIEAIEEPEFSTARSSNRASTDTSESDFSEPDSSEPGFNELDSSEAMIDVAATVVEPDAAVAHEAVSEPSDETVHEVEVDGHGTPDDQASDHPALQAQTSDDQTSDDQTIDVEATIDVKETVDDVSLVSSSSSEHEAILKAKIAELQAQLQEKDEALERIQAELSRVTHRRDDLISELAEAKRYILHLTKENNQALTSEASPQPKRSDPHPSHTPEPVQTSRPRKTVTPTSRQHSSPIHTQPQGLPPMSTEHLQGLPPMSTEPHRPSRSPVSARPAPRSTPSRSVPIRPPLSLPDRTHHAASPAPAKTTETQKPGALRRSPRPGLTRRDSDIPARARDSEAKVPKPKLSDAELSWFD